MKCPFCGYADTQVKDSRPSDDGTSIRRRRGCPKCHARFSTVEHVQLRDLTVIKKDGTKVPFERDKFVAAACREVGGNPPEARRANRVRETIEDRVVIDQRVLVPLVFPIPGQQAQPRLSILD